MKKKYNIALTPINIDKRNETVNLAKKFSNLADAYLLGENSIPHVTLYQFEIDENEVDVVWQSVVSVWQEKSIHLEFKEFSCLSFDGQVHWVSVLPNNCLALHKMHAQVAEVLKLPVKKNFDPHMTLISTKNAEYKVEVDKVLKSYKPMSDDFILTLGHCDGVGQLTKVVCIQEEKQVMTLRR